MIQDRAGVMTTVLALLCAIAPETQRDTLAPGRPLRQQVDLDSMDWLNFLINLHQHFGVDIPEADYARLVSLDDVVDYLRAPAAAGPGSDKGA